MRLILRLSTMRRLRQLSLAFGYRNLSREVLPLYTVGKAEEEAFAKEKTVLVPSDRWVFPRLKQLSIATGNSDVTAKSISRCCPQISHRGIERLFRTRQDIKENPAALYMKGDPHAPQCGFSETATRIFKVKGVPFPARNNLEGQGPWEAMKTSGNNNGTLFLHPMICFGVRRTSSFKDAEIVLLDEKEFHKLADELLHYLQEKFDELGEENDIEGFDIDHAEGVVTIKLGAFGTYVINKQTPNRQVWLSSPVRVSYEHLKFTTLLILSSFTCVHLLPSWLAVNPRD